MPTKATPTKIPTTKYSTFDATHLMNDEDIIDQTHGQHCDTRLLAQYTTYTQQQTHKQIQPTYTQTTTCISNSWNSAQLSLGAH